jgi:ABC-2 type transport system ATP-binding protein
MIELKSLTKRYGYKTAVDNLSFNILPGQVTGFLGPNGAGKSTTMRLLLGLDRPDSGSALIDGVTYANEPAPLTKVGALLDAKAFNPSRTGRDHLLSIAATHHIAPKRVDNLIEFTGLDTAAHRKAGGYSLGMSQRLGIAAALIGDPEILILDEPINGLDPEGVIWVRELVKRFAAQGRTVFISSHLMSEMSLVADQLVIIGKGRLIANAPLNEILRKTSGLVTEIRSPQVAQIANALASDKVQISYTNKDTIEVTGLAPEQIAPLAAQRGWVIYEIKQVTKSLEDAYLDLTDEAVEYRSTMSPAAHNLNLEGALR